MLNLSKMHMAGVALFCLLVQAKAYPDSAIPDIRDLPRLQAGLKAGTLAWATVDQLHASQPQTGLREVYRKADKFEGMLPNNTDKFPHDLYENLIKKKDIVPVYIGKTPRRDSRFGQEDVLGWVVDRTHGSNALAQMIIKVYGKKALSTPIYSKKGRPLNFVLVRVMGDQSNLNMQDFSDFMVKGKHTYLQEWSRGPKGTTVVEKIGFWDLPEKVYETTDNPYRGLIGQLQHKDLLGRSATDFSQFVDAEALLKNNIVSWDDISLDASKKDYAKAMKQAADFFASPAADGLPGTKELRPCIRALTKK